MASVSIDTLLGTFGIEASEVGVHRVLLPGSGEHVGSGQASERASTAAAQVAEYARGEREQFEIEVDWSRVDVTHRHVLETLRAIAPYGTTVTYGELGVRTGVRDPREVGVLMARNPLPLVIPCHRVVASDGVGGYGGGVDLKRRLLELEGVLPPRLELGCI